ncbi:hypothetical protein ABPG77_002320 [Micractinium sp. CCAP 211/92]
MQQALLFAQSVRALQSAKAWSPDVCRRIMQWRAAQGSNVASASKSVGRTRSSFARAASAQDLSTSSIDQQCATPQPAIPLCERPAEHTAPLADLLAWREAAEQQVAAVGTSWEREDDGPSVEDLQTELGWLLDDALAAMARPGGDWRPTSWRQLERDLRLRPPLADAACQYLVQLREPLELLCEAQHQEPAGLCAATPVKTGLLVMAISMQWQ